MATHSSVLAWKIPWTGEPGRPQSMGSQRVRHDWATSLECFQYCEYYEFSDCIYTWCIGMEFNFPVGHSFSVSFTGEQHHTMLSQFSSVQSLSRVQLFVTPWIAARQASLSITNSRSSLRLTSIEPVMPYSHLMLCRPLLLLPPIPPSIRVFSNESRVYIYLQKVLFGRT